MGLMLFLLNFYTLGVVVWFLLVSVCAGSLDREDYKYSIWSWGLVVLLIMGNLISICCEKEYNIYVE